MSRYDPATRGMLGVPSPAGEGPVEKALVEAAWAGGAGFPCDGSMMRQSLHSAGFDVVLRADEPR